ncbi:PREDICTED: uncharacterized protein LOC109128356 [Camelina sativa]|uniref:Uncharacterized protein LOC109128356 n=1 Tax=Camelina sativa TaxID=90675 RepID=A0ABM1QTL9_CAMSA|nr:PREDICTED: uncharacterized protein LOC109128356 [Camelina sativa]
MTAPQANYECVFGVTNIKSHIPIILDLDDHNYDAWRELFRTHCLMFDVLGHLDGTMLPANANDAAWYKRDGLVKLWNYGYLAPDLFRSSFETGGTACDNQEIGDQTIQEYCQKIKSLAALLTNVNAPVNERTLVMYLLNGLNEKFDYIINVIKHKDPFPTFEVAKSMLELEESRLKKTNRRTSTHFDHSSSTTALTVATSSPEPRPNNQTTQRQQFNNNNRGNHRSNNRSRGGGRNNNQSRPQFPN